ncbi:MAG: MipA/OmpV family protein [Caulobacteraceae bacterium]|nr:MipA/OmpV family protein [Caulobacteraceae bacterium]
MIRSAAIALAALIFAALALTGPAAAQGSDDEGWSVTLGGGALYAPTYEGDDESRLSLLPSMEVTYGDDFFASVQNGAGYRIINTQTLKAGPIGRIAFSRSENGEQTFAIGGNDTGDLKGLGDVDASAEVGGFIKYGLGGLTLSLEARQALSGHQGWVADLGASWSGRSTFFGRPLMWSAGPRARLVGDNYSQAYFGVTPSQSGASGLPAYGAGGGLHAYGLGASLIAPLSRDGRSTLVFLAGYDRLTGDAGHSPLVQLRGSEEQSSIGLFLVRRFP